MSEQSETKSYCKSCKKSKEISAFRSFRNFLITVKTCAGCRNRVKKAHQKNRAKYNSKYFGKYSKNKAVKVDNVSEEKKEK